MKHVLKWIACAALLAAASLLHAGTACRNYVAKPNDFYNASHTALSVTKKLDRSGAQVALLARVGSDLSRYGLHYSHIAFVVKNYPGKKGKWTVIHLLNECNQPTSSLYAQGLMNFFMDNLYSQDYAIVIPNQTLQSRLYQALQPAVIERLHQKEYSMIAYPFASQYQNSNQWVLEVLADASTPQSRHSRQAAQASLRRTGYKPTVVHIDAFAQFGASLSHAAVHFNDHPNIENRMRRYSIVSVDSVIAYLRSRHLIQATS